MDHWDVRSAEERDAVRFSWNVWPSSRLEATRIVVPVGCLYTPMKSRHDAPPPLSYDPIRCNGNGCGAILNPYAQVDFMSKLWTCPFCMQRNHFPPHYAENISETNLPYELIPQFTTVEYELTTPPHGPPAFVFCVDTCISDDELDELKDSLQQTLSLLPEEALVGLVTFGTNVMVHELGFAECPKSYVFRGAKEYAAVKVQELLGIMPAGRGGYGQHQHMQQQPGVPGGMGASRDPAIGRFLMPVTDASFQFEMVLDDLQRDAWPVPSDQRVARCTGTALQVALGLVESACPRQGSRVMVFVGGPPTVGPGAMVDRSKNETIRSHTDLQKNNAPHFKAACKLFETLADKAVSNCHIIDLFACSLDQIGLLEMKVCIEKTGGQMVLADSFGQSVFKESLSRLFRKPIGEDGQPLSMPPPEQGGGAALLQMGFGATMEVLTSREFKVAGAIGPCSSLNKKGTNVAETEIGQGGTYAWSLGGITPATTIAVYFEVTNNQSEPLSPHKRRFLQFVTQYQQAGGRYRLRTTTVCGGWQSDPQQVEPLVKGFDQEAAAVLMARLAVHRTETEEVADTMRWLDRSLIRLCAKFAHYVKDKPESFRLAEEFSMYPQYMFHLRRSQFLQLFNSSPDEASYYRGILCRENTASSLVMLQPSLLSYSFQGPPTPAMLDAASVRPDTILLLDTFFHVVIFHGETIGAWREQKYQDHEEHAAFRQLLEAPQADAQLIMQSRCPVPRYIVCDQHKSEARFLISKLNPSVTHNTTDGSQAQAIFTDDVSLRVFMEHLMKLSTQS